ncbi:HAD family hydrolase [Streptomyces sp. A5-4]|uniref:HAD family hydrolase n=1 Tax=Streptomyces sp. A5-4 TaxID=3384771 RepID=UPI003DA7E6D4
MTAPGAAVMHVSAVLFDMDGILVDTDAAVADLWAKLGSEYGVAITADDLTTHIYGCVPEHTVETVFSSLSSHDRMQILRQVRRSEPDLALTPVPLAAALVEQLADEGVPLALVTGASTARAARALEELGLSDRFGVSVTWGEAERGKPAPDCYLLAAERLNIDPADCLVFEDTSGGVRAAVAAGASCIAVSGSDPARLSAVGARHVVPSFASVRLGLSGGQRVLDVAELEQFPLATR